MSRVVMGLVVAGSLMAATHPMAGQQPTFRSGVDLVTVDATVVAGDGRPLDNLGPDDFRLTVDGHPRRLLSAQFVSQATRGARSPRPAAAHFSSNEDEDAGRLVVVAVDEAHIRRLEGRPGLRAAESFIDRLDATDRVAVIGLARLGALDFTRDRLALRRRLAALTGQTDPVFQQFNLGLSEALEIADGGRTRLADAVLRECGRALTDYVNLARAADDAGGRDACPEQVEQEARAMAQHAHIQARISLSALEALIVSLKDIPGPKTIVVLSEGMVADPRRVDLAKVASEAQAARVTIYALHLEVPTFEAAQDRVSPTFVRDLQVRGDGLARIAGAARGAVFRLVGTDPRPFERIARELSGYYLLAFEPLELERDGRAHRIQVSLARGGGELRARPGFTLPAAPASAPPASDARLVSLLRASALSTELPVRVATYAYAEPHSNDVRVVVSAEAGVGDRTAPSARLGFVLIDAGGVITASAVHDAVDGRYSFSASVPAGGYRLRVGAIDALGRHGNVERPFNARVAASRGVRVSDLMLAPPPLAPRDALEPLIDRIGVARVIAYLEMIAAPGEPLPDLVRVAVVPEAGGEAVSVATATVTQASQKPGASGEWAVARAVIQTATLKPGRYVARAEVLSRGSEVTRVIRPFSIPD